MKSNRYFRHDWNARNDPKVLRIVREKGAAAKAIYWDLVEMLYEEDGKLPLDMIEEVSFQNRMKNSDVAHYVVFDSGLFEHDDHYFWSERQRRDELKISEISAVRRAAGKAGGLAKRSNCQANANQMPSNKIKEIKENKDTASIPSKDSIEACPPQDGRTQETLLEFEDKTEDKEILNQDGKAQDLAVLSPKQCQQVVDFWNRTIDETKASLPKVKTLGEDRIKKIRVRWREFSELGDPVEVTRQIFKNACTSKFFQGDNHNGWSGNFDWIFTNSKNWAKVYEGNYNDNKAGIAAEEQQKQKKTYKTIQDLAKDQGWS